MPDIDIRPRPIAETLIPLFPSSRCSMTSLLDSQFGVRARIAILIIAARAEAIDPVSRQRNSGSDPELKQVEVLPMLPVADFEVEARDLGFLEAAVVVDEGIAEPVAQRLVDLQVLQRLFERARQEI